MTEWERAIHTAASKVEGLYLAEQELMAIAHSAGKQREAAYHGSRAAALRAAVVEIKTMLHPALDNSILEGPRA